MKSVIISTGFELGIIGSSRSKVPDWAGPTVTCAALFKKGSTHSHPSSKPCWAAGRRSFEPCRKISSPPWWRLGPWEEQLYTWARCSCCLEFLSSLHSLSLINTESRPNMTRFETNSFPFYDLILSTNYFENSLGCRWSLSHSLANGPLRKSNYIFIKTSSLGQPATASRSHLNQNWTDGRILEAIITLPFVPSLPNIEHAEVCLIVFVCVHVCVCVCACVCVCVCVSV